MKKLFVMLIVFLMVSNFVCVDEGLNDGSEICWV